MSHPDSHQKLTDALEEMSVEQMRLYQAFITKKLEFRVAEEALLAALDAEEGGDAQTSAALANVRRVLGDQAFRLSGNECVLLACLMKRLEGEDRTDTKRVNTLLHSFGRKPSNTTKVVDSLEKKGMVGIDSEGLHAHKMYSLTDKGQMHVFSLLEKLTGENGGDRLAVVG